MHLLGRGTFGKVFLAKLRSEPNKEFAIKAMRKDSIIAEGGDDSKLLELICTERDVLMRIDHPFLCGAEYVFQSECRIYFVLPYFPGGELQSVLDSQKKRRLSED